MQALKERLHLLKEQLEKKEKELKKLKTTAFYESVTAFSEGNFIQVKIYCEGGMVKMDADDETELFLNGIPVVKGEYFYLNKGEYLLKGKTSLKEGTVVKAVITGDVKETSRTKTKGVNFNDESFVLCERDNEFSLYKYGDEVFTLIKSESGQKADLCKGDVLYYALLKEGMVTVQKYSGGNFVQVGALKCDDFLCDYTQKLTLYIVKKGYLHICEYENGEFNSKKTKIKTDKLYAIQGEKAVYRDTRGNIRLSFNIARG